MNRRDILTAGAAAVAVAAAPAVAKAATVRTPFEERLHLIVEKYEPYFASADQREAAEFTTDLFDAMFDAELDGEKNCKLVVTREAFKYLRRTNMIDYLPVGENGEPPYPCLLGWAIEVPGTVYATAMARTARAYA